MSPDETVVGYDVYCDMKTAGGGWMVGNILEHFLALLAALNVRKAYSKFG